MQVRFGKADAEWHRFALDHEGETRTACGKPITSYRASREPKYEEPLCRDGCFTPYELKLAVKRAAEQKAAAQERATDSSESQLSKDIAESRARRRRESTKGEDEP